MNWIYYLSRMEKRKGIEKSWKKNTNYLRETFGYYIQNFRSPIFISLTTAPPKERGGRNSIFRIVKHALWTTSKYPSTYLLLAYFRFLFEPERRSAHKRIERSTKGCIADTISAGMEKSTRNGQNLITFRSGARSYRSSLPPPTPNFHFFFPRTKSSNLLPSTFVVVDLCTPRRGIISMNQPQSGWKFNESSLFTGNSPPNGGRGFIIDRARDIVRSTRRHNFSSSPAPALRGGVKPFL